MNLNKLNVTELQRNETKDINGGWLLGALAAVVTILSTDWDKVGDDISRGWKSY